MQGQHYWQATLITNNKWMDQLATMKPLYKNEPLCRNKALHWMNRKQIDRLIQIRVWTVEPWELFNFTRRYYNYGTF